MILIGCAASGFVAAGDIPPKEAAHEYFLVQCIEAGFGHHAIFDTDHSSSLYIEAMNLGPKPIDLLKSMANDIGSSIPVSNHSGKKGVFAVCSYHYHSRKLTDYINELYANPKS